MKDLNHENLNTFIGVCFHGPTIYVLTVYCSRGSLEDILEQDEIKLDWMFKTSLIQDLTNVSVVWSYFMCTSHSKSIIMVKSSELRKGMET